MDASCHRCDHMREDLIHHFWNCPLAKQVRKIFLPDREVSQNINMSFFDWVEYNLRRRDKVSKWDAPWNYLFTTIIWHIWKDRNLACFEEISKPAYATAKLAIAYAKEIHTVFTLGKSLVALKRTNLVKCGPFYV